ncbi:MULTISPECIES: cytochrome aa3 quinol oxidase subunit IV [Bacillus]|uniref:Quinol oxidase subunit 4 n=2 Tax=Bacillus TaxID=1386 RepID=A0A0M4FZ73_9BACI|nr:MULTISPECIES: cytochrome aa3 quinol oxidase subunit IV [Bacillus]ALC82813.1 quinol oxidase subunit 4 [Bacillus gobiensis]MBP1081775.1 cytochrome aa3-600 menaquinol oxidase subunit 4 [Bacillus capparidis]MED1096426.1 cytochrome aa3 quinol oxidase subunit IV [Bacillus capparidis]
MAANSKTAEHNHFPWKHVIGFGMSIVLTLIAFAVVLWTDFSTPAKLWIIFGLALIQAAVQLFLFMHMSESDNGTIQVGNTLFGFFTAIAIVIGTIWIFAAHYHHGDNMDGHSPSQGEKPSEQNHHDH